MSEETWQVRVEKELAYRRTIGCESSAQGFSLRQDVSAVLELQKKTLQELKDHADDPAINAEGFQITTGWKPISTWRMLMERFEFGDLLNTDLPTVAPP